MAEYETDVKRLWVTIAATVPADEGGHVYAWEYPDFVSPAVASRLAGDEIDPFNACVALNADMKTALWFQEDEPYCGRSACTTFTATTESTAWMNRCNVHQPGHSDEEGVTGAIAKYPNEVTCALYRDFDESAEQVALLCAVDTNNGRGWVWRQVVHDYVDPDDDGDFEFPSLAVNTSGSDAYALYLLTTVEEEDSIIFQRSGNYGLAWPGTDRTALDWSSGADRVVSEPCIAARGSFLFACWTRCEESRFTIVYRWSTDSGASWNPGLAQNPAELPLWPDWTYGAPNASVYFNNAYNVVLTYETRNPDFNCYAVQSSYGAVQSNSVIWRRYGWMSNPSADAYFDPAVATAELSAGHRGGKPHGCCVWSDTTNGSLYGRALWRRTGRFGDDYSIALPPVAVDNTGRRLRVSPDGSLHFAGCEVPHVVAGPVWGDPMPFVVEGGERPALAVDGDGERWVAYLRGDTLWCTVGEEAFTMVYAGSGLASPGQPSIATYPDVASGEYAAALTFAVYDSAAETSSIMFAKVHAGSVILDTVETYATLGDSYPSINIYLGDTLAICWQHGDSILTA